MYRCTRLVWASFAVGFLALTPMIGALFSNPLLVGVLIGYVVLAVLRVYALTQRRLIAAAIFLLLFIPLVSTIVSTTQSQYALPSLLKRNM